MSRSLSCLFLLSLILLSAPRAAAGVPVTEKDLHTYRDLQFAEALRDARKMFARGDAAKLAAAEKEIAQAFASAGWTRERFGEIGESINEVFSSLISAENGEISPEELKSALAEFDPATVATVKAHFAELKDVKDGDRAEKQVRDEMARERAGTPPTAAQLTGTWVFDAKATLDLIMGAGSSPDRAKMEAEVEAKAGKPSYAFGPGNAVEVRSKAPDGTEKVERGTFRIDGNQILFGDGRKERPLQAGLRDGKLILGTGFGAVVFSRK